MRAKSYEQVCRFLAKSFSQTSFEMITDGKYSREDSDWNYKDIPHLNVIHSQVDTFYPVFDDKVIATINYQKVLGLRIPLVVVNFESGPFDQTYYTSFGPYILVVNTISEDLAPNQCRTTTRYSIFSPKALKFTHFILKGLVKKNYSILMSEDTPMRLQRGHLREHGYRFMKDGDTYTFSETVNISRNRVIPPSVCVETAISKGYLQSLEPGSHQVGDTPGLLQFLIVKTSAQRGLIFPKTCPHEGADIVSTQICSHEKMAICPWHGRRLSPIAEWVDDQFIIVANDVYQISDDAEKIRISVEAYRDAIMRC